MILEIKGLRIRSSSDIKSVLINVFNIGAKDIILTEYYNHNGSIHIQVSNQRISDYLLSQNGRKLRESNQTLLIRKLKSNYSNSNNHYHSNPLYSSTLFKVNKIPVNWDIQDVVKYFSVSCNAPLRTCYRLNEDIDNVCTQYVFVEFMSAQFAHKARNILDRNQNCLGIIPIQTKNISKILQYYPSYIAPKHKQSFQKPIDNNGGTRAFGSLNYKSEHFRGYKSYRDSRPKVSGNKAQKAKNKNKNRNRSRGSSLNGNRLKRQLMRAQNKPKSHKKQSKKRVIRKVKSEQCNSECCSYSECSSDSSESSSYSYSSQSNNDTLELKTEECEEGEIKAKKSKKIKKKKSKKRPVSLRNKSKKSKNEKKKSNSIQIKEERNYESYTNANNQSPKSASIASMSASPRHISLDLNESNSNSENNLMIFGINITNASEMKEITKKIASASQFVCAAMMSDAQIIQIWNDIISFFRRNPTHYTIHLDYVYSLILSVIHFHSYLVPLDAFLRLPIQFWLELCSGNSIAIVDALLSIKYQRFHAKFQNLLIANIDTIIAHNSGINLIKLAFRKLCKSSLYSIVQIIDQKNYKQLSKQLIPIIRNRQNNNSNKSEQTTQSKVYVSPAPSSMSLSNDIKNDQILLMPPPPPPRKSLSSGLPALESDSSSSHSIGHKRSLNGLNDIMYPLQKKLKISHKRPTDPRVNRNGNNSHSSMHVVYGKRNDSHFVNEWNVNVKSIVGNIDKCIENILDFTDSESVIRKNVISTVKSLSNELEKYGFEKGLLKYLDSMKNECLSVPFYRNMFEIMDTKVFGIPESIYTRVEINESNKDLRVMNKLRNICKEETVVFVNIDRNEKYSFCVCSERLGIVQINNDFMKMFDVLLNMKDSNNDCIKHFKFMYDLWKVKGVNMHCCDNIGRNDWINLFIAYLYLILDICRIDYHKIVNKYLNKFSNVSLDFLSVRVLEFVFENVRQY